MRYGYARVSLAGTKKKIVGTDVIVVAKQELGRQIQALKDSGCQIIYQEKISGGKDTRPELDALLSVIKPGDYVVIQKFDRFARSFRHLINTLHDFEQRKIKFVSLGDNIDTSTPQGKLMFHIIASFAEFERSIIRERVKDGIQHKRKLNSGWGPAPRVSRDKVIAMVEAGFGPSQIAKVMKCSRQTIHNIVNAKALSL